MEWSILLYFHVWNNRSSKSCCWRSWKIHFGIIYIHYFGRSQVNTHTYSWMPNTRIVTILSYKYYDFFFKFYILYSYRWKSRIGWNILILSEGLSAIHQPYKHKLFEFWSFSLRSNNGPISLFHFLDKSKQTVTLSSCADLLSKSTIKTKIEPH